MNPVKKIFKRNTHNVFFGALASFGRSVYRLYENRNHDISSNGEQWLISRIAKINPKVVFDVGANTGKYCSVVYDYCPQAKIFCFEPVSKTFEMLKANMNKKADRIEFVQKGLYKEDSQLEINIYPSHTHASLFDLKAVPYEKVKKETISLVNGDRFIESNNITKVDFLKLDIEGAELDALKGFEQSLRAGKIRCIQFEYGYINITTKNLLVDYYDFLSSLGYVLGKLYPKSVSFRDYQFKHEDFIGPNYVAVHKDEKELINLLH